MTIRHYAVGVIVVLTVLGIWLTGPMDLLGWVVTAAGLYLIGDFILCGPLCRWQRRRGL